MLSGHQNKCDILLQWIDHSPDSVVFIYIPKSINYDNNKYCINCLLLVCVYVCVYLHIICVSVHNLYNFHRLTN